MTMAEIKCGSEGMISKKQWCLCPLNSEDMMGDILLPDQGEVKIGRAILGLHKNPCHVKKVGQPVAQDIPADRFIQLGEGDQISLMCTYAYAVDYKDINSAQPPKFRSRSSSVLTTATVTVGPVPDPPSPQMQQRHHFVNYAPVVPREFERGAVPEEEEIEDDALPQGDLQSHMSWREPDKGSVFLSCYGPSRNTNMEDVPGPDRYHQDWLLISITDDVREVQPRSVLPQHPELDEEADDVSLFSNHSEEKYSHRHVYNQQVPPKPKAKLIWRNICGKTPNQNE